MGCHNIAYNIYLCCTCTIVAVQPLVHVAIYIAICCRYGNLRGAVVGQGRRPGHTWITGGCSWRQAHTSWGNLCPLSSRTHDKLLFLIPSPHDAEQDPHGDVCHSGHSFISHDFVVSGFVVLLHTTSGNSTSSPDDGWTAPHNTVLSFFIVPQQSHCNRQTIINNYAAGDCD